MPSVQNPIIQIFKNTFPKSLKMIFWLLKIILPVSLAVSLLQYWGVIAAIAIYLEPLFRLIGLPGESAVVFISSVFLPLYAPIAIITTMQLDLREITILALMCLISHNMFVESAIQGKTGSKAVVMFIFRIAMSFFSALILNALLPDKLGMAVVADKIVVFHSVKDLLVNWLINAGWLSLKITLIITGLLLLQNVLKEFHLLHYIAKLFVPFMKIFGLSKDSSFLWFVAQTLGLTYGSVVMLEAVEHKDISIDNAKMLNYHIAVNHSLLEDTLLFVAIGVPVLWIVFPRIILATLVVWIIRFFRKKEVSHS